jgi:hypothetical protein
VPVAASNSPWIEQHILDCSYLRYINQAIQGTKQSLSLSIAFFAKGIVESLGEIKYWHDNTTEWVD